MSTNIGQTKNILTSKEHSITYLYKRTKKIYVLTWKKLELF